MEKFGIKRTFEFCAYVSGAVGLALLLISAILKTFNIFIDPAEVFEPYTILAGMVGIGLLLGPYVATVDQLKKVQCIKAQVQTANSVDPKRQRLYWLIGGGAGIALLVMQVSSRSFMLWFSFGSLLIIMAAVLFYLAWRINQFEKASNITIYMEDPTWRFDATSYTGVFKPSGQPLRPPPNG